ncbi:MAG: phosphoesterase [Candidatus Parcubacteria bacterium]|nr:MAG: phosphoesterase [Candidatus Parcubacteria bacterium]
MRLLVASDSHDHWPNLARAIVLGKEAGCGAMLFAGDFISPLGVDVLAAFPGPVHFVLGNNDGEGIGLRDRFAEHPNIVFHYHFGESVMEETFEGLAFHMNHYPHLARMAAESGKYDVVVYGHTHEVHEERLPNGSLLINPGAVCGVRASRATAMILDTASKEVDVLDLAHNG